MKEKNILYPIIGDPSKGISYQLARVGKNNMSLEINFVGGTDKNPVQPRDMLDIMINIIAYDIREKIKSN